MKVSKGQNIILTQGEYSDYSILDVLVVQKDFDTAIVMQDYLAKYPDQSNSCQFDEEVFRPWLEETGLVMLLPIKEWHTDDYGCVIVNDKNSDWRFDSTEDAE